MKREEAIKDLDIIRFNPHWDELVNEEYRKELMEMAITALQNQPVWIPVSERLPEESLNSVIGWDTYRNRCCFVQYLGGRFVLGDDNDSVNVTAWMPLPEPYRESEPHKQTNADRIRSMTDEELAMALLCVLRNLLKSDKVCKDCTLAWLQKESEE
jgi:hypothetical protein